MRRPAITLDNAQEQELRGLPVEINPVWLYSTMGQPYQGIVNTGRVREDVEVML